MKKPVIILIALSLILGIGLFYWFQWRPSEIRKECGKQTIEDSKKENWNAWTINARYRGCLILKGAEPESMFVDTK